jgi:hypothetical protein
VTRACEQAIDLANHVIRAEKIGIPTDSAESFEVVDMGIVERVITVGLGDLLAFADQVLRRKGGL